LTSRVTFLEDGDRVVVTAQEAQIVDCAGSTVERPVRTSTISAAQIGKGDHKHFMHKEIHEQPAVLGELINGLVFEPAVLEALAATPRLTMAACGTAAYACRVGAYWLESLARLPCAVDIASEFRYRTPPLPEKGAALFVSQSGETLDTLEALRYARSQGQTIISILNTIESTMERESDYVLRTHAGPEIGVASTKATAAQLTVLAGLALALAGDRPDEAAALRHLPALMVEVLERETEIAGLARVLAGFTHMLYIGRGPLYPLACEGSLKMKEISYIHAEAYAGGEFKHGPIALIDEDFPTVALAPSTDPLFDKMRSNMEELAARGGKILLLSDADGVAAMGKTATWSFAVPEVHPFTAPILYLLPLQLLAYHAALAKGTDADQPRNLAKSVTVE
jgi:glucosamine--fructose-6-phosphate aminotransferase (isomerizing)